MRLKPGETPAVYVDVDWTLVFWSGPADRVVEPAPAINWPLVTALREWHRDGRVLVIWSRGGIAHACWASDYCGLNPNACLPKPRVAIDDGPRSVTAGDHKGFAIIGPHRGYEAFQVIEALG